MDEVAVGTITGADFINHPAGLTEDTSFFLDKAIDAFGDGIEDVSEVDLLNDGIASIENMVVEYGGQVNGLVEGTFIGPGELGVTGFPEGVFVPEFAIGQIDVTLEFPGEGGENGNGFEFVTVAETKDLFAIGFEGIFGGNFD